jgi:hypothetical protein
MQLAKFNLQSTTMILLPLVLYALSPVIQPIYAYFYSTLIHSLLCHMDSDFLLVTGLFAKFLTINPNENTHYVVIRGVSPGIYTKVTDVMENVCDVSGAYVRQLPSRDLAITVWRQALADGHATPLGLGLDVSDGPGAEVRQHPTGSLVTAVARHTAPLKIIYIQTDTTPSESSNSEIPRAPHVETSSSNPLLADDVQRRQARYTDLAIAVWRHAVADGRDAPLETISIGTDSHAARSESSNLEILLPHVEAMETSSILSLSDDVQWRQARYTHGQKWVVWKGRLPGILDSW